MSSRTPDTTAPLLNLFRDEGTGQNGQRQAKRVGMTRAQTVTQVVHRLVEHYKPERVYLVGSSARGEDRPDSDLDFLPAIALREGKLEYDASALSDSRSA